MCKWKAMMIPMLALCLCAGCGSKAAEPVQQESSVNAEDTQESEIPNAAETEVDNGAPIDDYIFPDSDTRMLTEADLAGVSKEDLRIGRNEIFARHGRKFASEDMKNYFERCSWYTPQYDPDEFDPDFEHILNSVELYNVELIMAYENGTEDLSQVRFHNSFEDTYKEICKYTFRTADGYDRVSNLALSDSRSGRTLPGDPLHQHDSP